MLSIERAKELLGQNISDEEAEKIRGLFSALAEIVFEKWMAERKQTPNTQIPDNKVSQ